MEKEAKETQNYQILNTTKIESRADEIMSHLDTAPDEVKKAFEALLTVEREQNTLALGSKRLDEIEVLSRESSYLFFDGILQDTTIAAKKIKESLELIHKSEYLSTFLREDGLFSLEGREYQFIPFKKGINYGRVKPEELESASPDDIFYILQPSSFLENYSVPGEDPFMINVLDVCRVEFKEGVDSAPVINAYDGSITSKTHDSYKASEYYGFAPNSLAQTSLFPSGTALLEFRGQADENDKVISRGLIAVYDNVIKTATKRGKIRGYTIKYSERYAHFDVVTPNLLLDAIQNTTGMKFSNFYNQYLATAQFAYGYTNLDTDDGFSRTYIPGPSARYPTYNELWSQLRAKDEWESRLYAAYEKYIDKFTSLNDSAKDDINDKTAYREMLMEGYNKLYKTLESDEVFKYYKMSRIHRGGPPALTIEDLPGYRGEWEVLAQHGFDDIKGFSSLIDITNRIFTFLHERYLMDDPVDRVLPDVLLDEALETADSTLSKLEKGALLGNNSELNPEQVKTLLSGKRGTTVIGGGQSLKTNARVCDVKIDSLVVDKRASAKKRYSQQAEDALASVPEFKRFNEELLRSPYVDFAELDRSVLKGEEGGVNLNAATEALAYLNSMPLGSTSKIAFKVRLLGRHKALGLYYSSDKTVALDRRVKGWKSTLEHEVTHHYDHNNQDRYSRNAVVGWIKANTLIPENSQFKERKNYYMSDVELFARGGEVARLLMLGGFQRLYHEALSKCRSDEERKQLNENPLSESILQSIRSNYEGLSDIEQRKSYKTYQSVIYVPFEKLKAGELKDFVNAYSAVYQARGIDRKFAANLELAASRAVALSRSARNGGAQGASKKLNYIFPRGFTRGLSLAISSEKIYDSYMRSRKDELGEQVKAHPEWYSKMKFDKMLDYDILPDIELITLNEVDLCADFVSDFIDNAHQEHAEVNMGEALDNTLSIPDLKEVLRHEDKYRNEQGNIQMAFDIS